MTGAWSGLEPVAHPVRIGGWTADVVDAGLDDLAIDGAPVLRGVRAVIRDHDWRTVPVVAQRVEADGAGVRIEFRAEAEDDAGAFDGVLTVRLEGDALIVAIEVTARAAFRRNRIGLVVLHGAELAGTAIDNTGERLRLPERISPHQPARGIRELRWQASGRANAVAFEGDEFEMEDQRNWTDASFKTYSTPLARPFPVDVAPGDVVRQAVRITSAPPSSSVTAIGVASTAAADAVVTLSDGGSRMPELVLGASTAPDAAAPDALAPLPVDAVLVELRAMDANWRAALERAGRDAAGLPLDVRIVAREPAELDPVLDALGVRPPRRLSAYDADSHVTEPRLWRALVDGAAARGIPAGSLLGGTRGHFTELNRNHGRLPGDLPALTFSIAAEMHDRSTRQVIESVGMQRLVARDAIAIAGERPVHVGPVTLRARANFVATTPDVADAAPDLREGYGAQRVPGSADPRQGAEALEAWVVASVAALAGEGVASVAYFEAWGPRGIQGTPAWRAFERLRAFAGRELLRVDGTAAGIGVLASREGDVLVTSLRSGPVTVRLRTGAAERIVDVPPYGVIALAPLSATDNAG